MKMPFGKHIGKELTELPRAYLVWLTRNVKLFGELQEEVEAILNGENEPKETYEEILEKLNFNWEA